MIVLLSVTPNTKAGTKEARWKTLKSAHTQPRGAFFGSWFELCHPNSAWLGRHKQLSQIPWQLSSMQQPQFLTMGANQRGTFFSPLPTNLDKSCPSQFLGQRICTQQLIKLAKPSGPPQKVKFYTSSCEVSIASTSHIWKFTIAVVENWSPADTMWRRWLGLGRSLKQDSNFKCHSIMLQFYALH